MVLNPLLCHISTALNYTQNDQPSKGVCPPKFVKCAYF